MKIKITPIVLLTVFLFLVSCSGDDDSPHPIQSMDPEVGNEAPEMPDQDPGVIADFDEEVVGIHGFPKGIEEYHDGNLVRREQYYFTPDGKLDKVVYHLPDYSSEDNYFYDSEGRLINQKNDSWKYKFYWENGRIIKADIDNPIWYGSGKIYYAYDDEGLLISAKSQWDAGSDGNFKTVYTYFENRNLKSIEHYADSEGNENYSPFQITRFNSYTDANNLFYEVTIIPGQIVQQHFPVSKETEYLTALYSEIHTETYEYEFDIEGRVIAKIFGGIKIVYLYY